MLFRVNLWPLVQYKTVLLFLILLIKMVFRNKAVPFFSKKFVAIYKNAITKRKIAILY